MRVSGPVLTVWEAQRSPDKYMDDSGENRGEDSADYELGLGHQPRRTMPVETPSPARRSLWSAPAPVSMPRVKPGAPHGLLCPALCGCCHWVLGEGRSPW